MRPVSPFFQCLLAPERNPGHQGERDREGTLRKYSIVPAVAALLALMPAAASAAEPGEEAFSFDKRQFTCPLGGARFEQDVGYSTFPLVTFPDGSYPGDEGVDAEIPVCPDNGLLILPDFEASGEAQRMVYSDYSAEDLARLPALIADPSYRAAADDGRHIQAWWLASKLGRGADLRFTLLQRSTWAAADPALRRKLVERLVEEGPALIEASGRPEPAKRMQLYLIVNGLRELGRFDQALALIDRIEQGGPAVRAPVDPENMYGPGEYAPQMRAVIAAKDMDRFPVALMPSKWANSICGEEEPRPPYGPLSPTSKAACARRKAEMDRYYAEEETALDEMSDLLEDRPALERSCAATPKEKRTGGLAKGCSLIEDERDDEAGEKLAKDGPALARACESTPRDRQDGPLSHACTSWEIALEGALADSLETDDGAYAILCPNDGVLEIADRASSVSQACASAARERYGMKIDRMLADPAALDRQCAALRTSELSDLSIACSQRASQIEQSERERIAATDAAFEKKCGRFRRELADISEFTVDDDEELRECRVIKSLRDSSNAPAPSGEIPESVFADSGSLMTEARARASAMIAKAKAEGTYPKRRPGDRF